LKLVDPVIRRAYVHVYLSLTTGDPKMIKPIGKDTYLYLTTLRDGFLVGVISFF